MHKHITRWLMSLALLCNLGLSQAQTFTHPCIPNTLEELDTIKANLDKEPWKTGYAALAADGRSQLDYVMGGPFEVVKRNPNENLWPWRGDMSAVSNLARMWYFTGNEAYAQKARDILIAWATTHKVFGGNESGLDLGDYALAYGGGASILRGTWPGWTQQDTITVQNYFRNVLWPATAAPYKVSGPANKGSLNLVAGAVIAVFCDDTEMFDHVVDVFRNYPGSGLPNILATGQMGETGRDMGHGFNDLLARTVTAEILWKQGVDVYSESDNRLLAAGEYHARNTSTSDTPFVPYGTVDYTYYANANGMASQDRITYYLLQNAYKHRLGLPTPWIDRKLKEAGVHGGNFMFAKTADFSTATPPPADPRPPVSPASDGLTLTTLGDQTDGRSATYENGVWTVTGLGGGTWTDGSDDCQFAYKEMSGDCAMVAKVTSATFSGSQNGKMGLMIRDNLVGDVSQRSWIGIVPTSTGDNLIEARSFGWTATWGGANWAKRSQGLPLPLPCWLKVERKGTVITSYISQDGTSWSPIVSSEFGNLPSTVYIGIHVSSGNATPNTATFENLAFTGGTGGLVTTPAAPAAMLASGSDKAITARWLPSFGATGYDLLRSTTSGSGYTVIANDLPADKTSYVDTSVSPGTTYYYVARAKNSAGTSGNSPEFYAALPSVPLMKLSLNDGAPNDNADDSANAASAFDDNFGSFWFNGGTTGWLQYDFGENSAHVIKRYTLVSAPLIPERDPKDWQFQGSDDGSSWTTLDTQTDQTFEFRAYRRTFDIGNTTAYRYYRLNVIANNGHPDFLHLSELGLWGDSGRVIPDGLYRIASRSSHKVMEVAGSADDAPLVQQTFDGSDSQLWDIQWQGNDLYRATHVASDKALDNGGSSTAGGNLVIQPSGGGDSQFWKLASNADGFVHIESENSGLVADVSGGSTADGANVIQETYNGSDSQQWLPGFSVEPQPTPPAPTGLSATPASIHEIDLSWTASPDAVSYNIKRATVSGGPYTTVSAGVNITNYTDTGLSAGTTYYYVVSAVNGSGEGAESAQATATTPANAPDAPTDLSTIMGTNQATLSWTASGGATSYSVKRSTTSGGPYTTIASDLTGTNYIDTTFTHDVTYYYVVIAENAYGSSPATTEVPIGPGILGVHLKFDETDGDIAADFSGGAHDATLVNGPGFAPGVFDNALVLPAAPFEHAQLPDGIIGGLADFTIATWVRVDAIANWQRIFDFGTGTDNYMFLSTQGPAGAGRPRFSIRAASVGEQSIDSSIALTTGTWTHVAVTRSGDTVSLYIDGSLAGSDTITINPSDLGFTTLNYLGRSQFTDPYFNGALDDFRLHAQAMSSAEITALANPPAGAPTRFAVAPGDTQATLTWNPNATTTYTVKRSTTSGGPYTTIATGLTDLTYTDTGLTNDVNYYYVVSGTNDNGSGPDTEEVSVTPGSLRLELRFDETGGSSAFDSGDFGADAALINGSAFSGGRIGNALVLDAASSQHATLPSGIVSDLNDFTIATWIKVNSFATWQRIFDFGTGTDNCMYLTTQYTGTAPDNAKLRFGTRTPTAAEEVVSGTGIALTADTWTHLAVTRSGDTVSLYVDGSLAGSGTITLSPADLGVTTQNYLGKSQWPDPYLDAALDDFRIYSQAFSAAEIGDLSTVPPAPSGLAATAGSGQVSLSWDAVSGALSYDVKRSTTSGGPYTTLQAGITATNFTDIDVASGTTYHYVVSATHSAGESPNSNEASATTAPDAPTGLTTTAGEGQVDLSWNASTGATSYTVLRATDANGPYTTLATDVTGTSYADTSAQPGWTYYYAVSAGNSGGESQASASATTTAAAVAISWLKLDETSGTTAADATGNNNAGTLVNSPAWIGGKTGNALGLNGTNQYATLPNGVTSNIHDFTVSAWVYWNGGGNWQRIFDFGSGTSTNMFLTPKNGANGKLRFAITTNGGAGEQQIDGNAVLPSGGWHHVAVTLSGTTGTLYVDGQQVGHNTGITLRPDDLGATTQNRIGRSQYNDPNFNGRLDDFRLYAGALGAEEISTLAAPMQTTGLAATGGSGHIDLTWDSTTGASSYTVRRATTSGGAYTAVATGVTGTSYTDTGLADGTIYYYVVTPADASGDGANSAEVAAPTIPATPENVVAYSSGGEVSLGWDASTGASGYDVLRATSPGGSYTTIATGETGTSYIDATTAPGTNYYYAIAATNGSGSSTGSTEVNTLTVPDTPSDLAATPDNGQVSLLWNASTGAATYDVLRSATSGSGYASVATGLTGTSYIDTGLTNDTAYYYVVTATNSGGTSANSIEANATPVALPSPWATSDIGCTGATGSASSSPDGVFTVTGAGADIWGSNDAFRYVYQTATGDCDVTARVTAIDNTHTWAKAGVMIRETLATGSRHAMAVVTPGKGVSFQRRTATNGNSAHTTTSGPTAPHWVRITRVGNAFTTYHSADGTNWTSMGSETISMSTSVYIGLPVTSHSHGTLCTGTFDNVTVTP